MLPDMRPIAIVPALLLLVALGMPAPAAYAQPAAEEIGSWRLTCAVDRMTDRADCRLRHRDPVEPAQGAQPAMLLEVQDRGGRLVPVVTARDLTLDGAARGLLALTGTAQLRFPPNRLFELPCSLEGRSLICAPKPEDLARAAEELTSAQTVLVRVVGFSGPGASLNAEPAELRLSETRAALARYRARVPEGSAPPPEQPADWRDLVQRLLRLLGQ